MAGKETEMVEESAMTFNEEKYEVKQVYVKLTVVDQMSQCSTFNGESHSTSAHYS